MPRECALLGAAVAVLQLLLITRVCSVNVGLKVTSFPFLYSFGRAIALRANVVVVRLQRSGSKGCQKLSGC